MQTIRGCPPDGLSPVGVLTVTVAVFVFASSATFQRLALNSLCSYVNDIVDTTSVLVKLTPEFNYILGNFFYKIELEDFKTYGSEKKLLTSKVLVRSWNARI